MERTMKKATAILIALLIMIQLVPAFAITYSSGMIVGSPNGFKEPLEIVASKGTYVLMGQTLELDVNEDYIAIWSSDDPGIAMIDENGLLTAVAPGTVVITAASGLQKATAEITVIDPAPIMEEQKAEQTTRTEPQAAPVGQDAPEQTAPAGKLLMVIVINGENERITYDGEEHILDRFIATSNEASFDAEKVRVSGLEAVKAKDCGFYELNLEACEFTYDDPNVISTFVVNNSYIRITPATATVSANAAEKEAGQEDPELTASLTGVFGDDEIQYRLFREQGEEPGSYKITVEGEEAQGNYRVQYSDNILTITEPPAEEELVVTIRSLYPADEPMYFMAEVTMEATVTGAEPGEYTIQWQYSPDLVNWYDIADANELRYTYHVDGINYTYAWRAVVDRIR